LLLNVLAGCDARDPACQDRPVPDYTKALGLPIEGVRVGVCRNHFFDRNEPAVDAAVEQALSDLSAAGARVHEFEIPNLQYGLAAIFAAELASSAA
jgi:aspartyl-tRNA(Asn)/glutamyl-tRNA(Gln) amidotransferase subunit A